MRLVNADALASELEKYSDPTARFRNEYLFGMQRRLETCIKLVKDAPTVDAVPVRHGRWIPVNSFDAFGGDEVTWMAHGNPIAYHYCSECMRQARAGEDGESLLTKYCPNCGADMRGDHEKAD